MFSTCQSTLKKEISKHCKPHHTKSLTNKQTTASYITAEDKMRYVWIKDIFYNAAALAKLNLEFHIIYCQTVTKLDIGFYYWF